jgi:hypothetical protein
VNVQVATPASSIAAEQKAGRDTFPRGPWTKNASVPAFGIGVKVALMVIGDPLRGEPGRLKDSVVGSRAFTEAEPEA